MLSSFLDHNQPTDSCGEPIKFLIGMKLCPTMTLEPVLGMCFPREIVHARPSWTNKQTAF